MKSNVEIGQRSFATKKEALLHYKGILNSYKFGQSLNNSDFVDLLALINYEFQISLAQFSQVEHSSEVNEEEAYETFDVSIDNIVVSKVQFNTKCFEVFYSNGSSYYISYIMLINRKGYTPEMLFTTACRNCVHKDIMSVKQEYFKKYSNQGKVKCQETNVLSSWQELAVDHRQPNTLSIIIDRFKELNNIELSEIEYRTTKDNLIIFKEDKLLQKFISYHRDKATLRVVRKEQNSSRSAMGRVKPNSKDLTIVQNQLPLF